MDKSQLQSMLRAAFVVLVSAGVGACQAPEISHPTAANIVADHKLTARIQAGPGPKCELSALAARLRNVRQTRVIPLDGMSTGMPKLRQVDSISAGSGEIVFVDSGARFVGIVSGDEAVSAMLDPGGRRSPDLDDVRRAIRTDAGRIVTTGRKRNATIFERTAAGYTLAASVTLAGRPEDGCTLGEDIYLRVPSAGKLITRMTAEGKIVGAFGEPYQIADEEIRAILSQGLLACAPSASTIVAMFGTFPEIYGFDSNGDVRWISRFEDFRRPRLIEITHSNHSMLQHSQPEVADRLWSLVPFESRYVIVQLLRFSPDTRTRPHEIRSYVLDAATGRGEFISQTLPRLRATSGNKLYTADPKSPLQVVVYTADAQ